LAAKPKIRLTDEQSAALEPFMIAGLDGLHRSRWKPGDPVEYLVAPIVLRVIIAVSREFRMGELIKEGSGNGQA
jgi:hypothetical protein